MGGGLPLRGPT